MSFLTKIFGSSNQRALKRMQVYVDKINLLESEYQQLSDDDLAGLRIKLKESSKDSGFDLLAHAFAATREASVRTIGLRHFDAQMLGGIALSEGNIAEMKTGEGKTLVATLPAYLNAIQDNKVILVTVNDYLAQRDADWMRPIYEQLGLTVGVVYSNQSSEEKKSAYQCDVIYATNGELGFDYLRDNMALRAEDKVQCSLDFAIVDEVDSILIDEARTPLIISGPSNESADYYVQIKKIIPKLKEQLREGTEDEPLTIGTVSVESSEEVSSFLKKSNINHQILNAKHHEREAEVIANAGKPGVVTIATNMAGRGTDIVLGGKKEDQDEDAWLKSHKLVLDAGGLHILGTERHESRRIDNQLRGRSGRQGDPGYSKFFLSLEDDLLRLFITDSRRALFEKIGMGDEPIEHRMLSRGIENAQRRIEARNFDARKNLLEYDDVANDQRQAIYALRNQLLNENDISLTIENNIEDTFTNITSSFIPLESVESQWKHKELEGYLLENFNLDTNISKEIENNKKLNADSIPKYIVEKAKTEYINKFQKIGESLKLLEKQIMLQVLDVHWKEHLAEIDHLRASIGLRAYAQKNPKNEYKREAYALFEEMLNLIDTETIRILFNLKLQAEENIPELKPQNTQDMTLEHASPQPEGSIEQTHNKNQQPNQDKITNPITRSEPKIGRNDFVKITNGKETKELKYKKAQSLIETGEWKII